MSELKSAAHQPVERQQRFIDRTLFIMANLFNLLMVGIFLSRPAGLQQLEHALGIILLVLTLPTLFCLIRNAMLKRGTWYWLLPLLLVLFLLLELLLEYIFLPGFRQTRWLGPYLGLYYLSLMGMIGYNFLTGKKEGFITLATYFLNQAATFYSYFTVGH